VVIEFSKFDVGDRTAPSDAAPPAAPPSAAALADMPAFPLFAAAPRAALMALAREAELIELSHNAPVVRVGEPSDALYAIVEGSVECSMTEPKYDAILSEGDVFGETCLLADETRRANVFVRGHLVALKIRREMLALTINAYPVVGELVFELLTRRLVGDLMRSSSLFKAFDASARLDLAKSFEVRRAPKGTVLLAAGKRSDGLYIPLIGQLRIQGGDGPERMAEPGTVLGQQTLVGNKPSSVTATAMSDLAVLRLPGTAFFRVANRFPKILLDLHGQRH
jgi:CRP-like cAMP-binding protein